MTEKKGHFVAPPQVSLGSWIMGGTVLVSRRGLTRKRPKPAGLEKAPRTKIPKPAPDLKLPSGSATAKYKEAEQIAGEICNICGERIEEPPVDPVEKPTKAMSGSCSKKPMEKSAEVSTSKGCQKLAKRTEEEPKSPVKPVEEPKKDDPITDTPTNLFTAEQDAELLKLKAKNVSWKQIATKMSLAKKDVQKRFNELQKAKPIDDAPEEWVAADVETATLTLEEKVAEDRNAAGEGDDNGFGNWGDNDNENWNENGNHSWNDYGDGNGNGNGKGKGKEANRAKKDNGGNKSNGSNEGNGNNGDYAGNGGNRGNGGSGTEHAYNQAWTWYGNGHADKDAPKRRLQPDMHWSPADCELLEMLEARYREQKWMTIQASFYNLTGRVIRSDILERKVSEAL